jgi:hypothetical protein
VAVAIVIAVTMMATFAHLFQFMAALLRLAAGRTVPAFGLRQPLFRLFDALAALPVVPVMVAIERPRGNGAGEEHCYNAGGDDGFELLSHAALLHTLWPELLKRNSPLLLEQSPQPLVQRKAQSN